MPQIARVARKTGADLHGAHVVVVGQRVVEGIRAAHLLQLVVRVAFEGVGESRIEVAAGALGGGDGDGGPVEGGVGGVFGVGWVGGGDLEVGGHSCGEGREREGGGGGIWRTVYVYMYVCMVMCILCVYYVRPIHT